MTKIYAVIDTNVIVSALYSHKTDAATILVLDNQTNRLAHLSIKKHITTHPFHHTFSSVAKKTKFSK